MFCPKCGKSEQTPETYCRQCGIYLTDYTKPFKKKIQPEEHLQVNTVLSLMSAVVSLTLAILLHIYFWGKGDTPIIIYITAGFMMAMFFWQAQTFWRTLLLKKHFKKRNINEKSSTEEKNEPRVFVAKPTNELLNEADLSNIVPTSVTENTTKSLDKVRSKKAEESNYQ